MRKTLIKNNKGEFVVTNLKLKDPSSNKVLIRNVLAGIDRYDLELMTGNTNLTKKISIFGMCSVGVVEKIGVECFGLLKGDRVLYCSQNCGAYSEFMVVDQNFIVKLPDYINDNICSIFLKIITAQYLVSKVYDLRRNSKVLISGISGGMGSIIASVAKSRKAYVFGLTRSKSLINNDTLLLCDEIYEYSDSELIKKFMTKTKLIGGNVFYDTIGEEINPIAVFLLGFFGVHIQFGKVTGLINNIHSSIYNSKSLVFFSPMYSSYIHNRISFLMGARNAFLLIKNGELRPPKSSEILLDDFPKYISKFPKEEKIGFKVLKF